MVNYNIDKYYMGNSESSPSDQQVQEPSKPSIMNQISNSVSSSFNEAKDKMKNVLHPQQEPAPYNPTTGGRRKKTRNNKRKHKKSKSKK
jgi:hypothetical protein